MRLSSPRLIAAATLVISAFGLCASCTTPPPSTVFSDECRVLHTNVDPMTYYHDGSAGDRFNVFTRHLEGPVTVTGPDGATLTTTDTMSDTVGDFRHYVLPTNGRYRVSLRDSRIGEYYTVCLSIDRFAGPITLGSTPIRGATGQTFDYAYEGTAGERLNVNIDLWNHVTIKDPSGAVLAPVSSNFNFTQFVLPIDGTYHVLDGPVEGTYTDLELSHGA